MPRITANGIRISYEERGSREQRTPHPNENTGG
jgi:hypothetical protein